MLPDESTVHDWLRWAGGKDRDLWKLATLRLGGLTPSDDVPLQPLLNAVRADQDPVAFWALVAISRLGERARSAVPLLRELVADHYAIAMRQSALVALSRIAPDDPGAKATLLAALGDASPFVRREALQALIPLKQLTPDDLLAIKNMEHDADDAVASWSEIALRNIRLRSTDAG